jgi:tetratricopeptide (TPR) repeat protein
LLALRPDDTRLHARRGRALLAGGRAAEAERAFARARQHSGAAVDAWLGLEAIRWSRAGDALERQGKQAEAVAAHQQAVRLAPKDPSVHLHLGTCLLKQGNLNEAVAAYRQALALTPTDATLKNTVASLEGMVRAGHKLPAVMGGKYTPVDGNELRDLYNLCHLELRYLTATRLFVAAFAARPKLASDLIAAHRYSAACAAALAAGGQGKEAGGLGEVQRQALRRQALTWLRADLRLRQKQLKSWWPGQAQVARTALGYWLKDPNLAGLREAEGLKRLSAEERQAWEQLWRDVAALLQPVPGRRP